MNNMTRSNIHMLRELKYSSSNDESELSIMTKSQELSVTKMNDLNLFEEDIIFCSDEENSIDELNQAVIYSSQDKVINDIKKWNRLKKLNNREPIYYCITQLEHVLNNVTSILERMDIENI